MLSDERLAQLLAEAERVAPVADRRFLNELYGRLEIERRRRLPWWHRIGWAVMRPVIAFGAAATVLALVALLAVGLPPRESIPVAASPSQTAPSPTAPTAPPASPTSSPAALSPTPSTSVPPASLSGSPSASAGLVRGGRPAAGTYTVLTKPTVQLTLPSGFRVLERSSDLFVVTSTDAATPSVIVDRVFGPGIIDSLAKSPQLTASTPVAVVVGGVAGRSIEVTPRTGVATASLFDTAETLVTYTLSSGSRAKVIELQVEGFTLALAYDAPGTEFAAFGATAEAIFATAVFPGLNTPAPSGSALPLGVLPAGTYTSRAVTPNVAFTTPGGLLPWGRARTPDLAFAGGRA